MTPPGTQKLAIDYSRVSGQDDESNDTQRLVCAETARRDGYVIPADPRYHYEDNYITGAARHRQGLDHLLEDVRSGAVGPEGTEIQVDCLYIRESARLWRGLDPRFPPFFEYLLQEHGIRVRYTDEENPADYSQGVTDSHMGSYITRTVNVVNASRERLKLRDKMRQKKRQLVLARFYPNAVVPYGLERILIDKRTREEVRVVPRGESIHLPGCRYFLRPADNEESRTVQFIYDSILEGRSQYWIVQELQRRGVPSPKGLELWAANVVSRIARSPVYKGTLLWGVPTNRRGRRRVRRPRLAPVPHTESEVTGEAPILYEDFLDPLIPKEQWERVQEILNGNQARWDRRRACSPRYLLSGKIECVRCGALYNGRRHEASPYKYEYYVHDPGYKKKYKGCPDCHFSIRAECLEEPVLARIRELLANGTLESIVQDELDALRGPDRRESNRKRAEELRKQILDLEKRLDAATDDSLGATGSHREKLVAKAKRLGAQLDVKRADLQALEEQEERLNVIRNQHVSLAADAAALVQRLDTMSFAERRAVIEYIVHVIRYDQQSRRADVVLRLNPSRTLRAFAWPEEEGDHAVA